MFHGKAGIRPVMNGNVEIRPATLGDTDRIYVLVQKTIATSLTVCYPPGALRFFREYHARECIRNDCDMEYCIVAVRDGTIVGTGTLADTNIRRIFVDPAFQRCGLGRRIMRHLEARAGEAGMPYLELYASLLAREFYESFDYIHLKTGRAPMADGAELIFFRMAKSLTAPKAIPWNLEGKRFITVGDSGTNVGMEQTVAFEFTQRGNLLYADYWGDRVRTGELCGAIFADEWSFVFEETHRDGEIESGRGAGRIFPGDGGKIQLTYRCESEKRTGERVIRLKEIF
jgi:GNAT superfamily N-acetyltransferase